MKKLLHKDTEHHHHDHNCNHEHHHHHTEEEHEHEHKHEEEVEEPTQRIIPRRSQHQLTFENFLQFFPEVELPISITSDTQRALSALQEPLSAIWASRFLVAEGVEIDEYTEFMACYSLPISKDYLTLVYWEAALVGSSYYLVTFSKNGVVIDHQRIAGTFYTDSEIIQTICTVQKGGFLHQIEAKMDAHTGKIIKTEKPVQAFFELTAEGKIEEE